MAQNQQYRISQLAKELGLKGKDITDILASSGIEGKTSSAALDPDEFGLVMDVLSKNNQISNLDPYLDGDVVIVTKGQKAAEAKKKAEAEAAAKAEAEKAEAKARAAAEAEAKAKAEAEAKAAAEAKAKAEAEAAAKAKAQAEAKAKAMSAAQAIEEKARAAAQSRAQAQQGDRRDNRGDRQQRPQGDRPVRTQGDRPQGDRPARPAQSDRPAQPKNFGDRFDRKPFDGGMKPNFDKKPQQKQRPDNRSKGGFDKDEGNERRTVQKFTAPISQMQRTSSDGPAKPRGSVRVVDTRTSEVDLSKYDEKLDVLAGNYGSDNSQSRQKLKKQDTRNQYNKAKDKERERMKKLELEKARKKQLEITVPDEITVQELASRLKVTAAEVIKRLMMMGVMATLNQTVDFDTAYLVADELGAKVTKEVVVTIEERLFDETEDSDDNLITRDPVVCVMGHVDHGKTSLLDAIRHTSVTSGEAGGITQHIGAYRVQINGKDITFLDTPGHEAFTAMRARGAQATDIAILVVAADDGIMPQTVEAINHAKAAGIEIIVAINKMDKPTANPEVVMTGLTQYELVPEEWGGDVICVPVSALTGKGIDDLLENVLLVAEVKELKANPGRRAKGIVIESKLDKGRGPVATVLVQNGTLHSGDIVIAGTSVGHVRAMTNDKGQEIKVAGPSVPVEIIGLDSVPVAGDEFNAVEDERMARTLAEQRMEKAKNEKFKANASASLDDLFARISDGVKDLNVIVKADVDGSVEAVKQSLQKLSNEEVKVNVIHGAVGGITENDVMLASASDAIIVGFNVRPDRSALDAAERQSVDVRTYRVIYECIEEIEAAMKGMLAPKFKEALLGHAEVRQTIRVPNVGTIAGCYIQDGKITRNAQIRVVRDGIVIFEDKISSLRRFKDDVREVASGYECGVGLERFNDIKEGDVLEAFIMEEIER
ncbi:MAG: translation initiation factor IF-2 [Clostridia bacterium]|nr:translation initiation factor IF-2 [Clostridia bacterium]